MFIMSTSGIFRRSSVQLSMFPLSISSIFWCLTSTIRLLFRSLRKLSFSSVSRPRLTAFLAISSRFRSSNFPLFYECTEFFYAHFVDSFIHRHTIRCHDENSGPHFVRYGAPSRDTFLRNNRKFDNRNTPYCGEIGHVARFCDRNGARYAFPKNG